MQNLPTIPRRWQLLAPLAAASTAIVDGMWRRQMQRLGMAILDYQLAGLLVVTYTFPGPQYTTPIVLIPGLGASATSWVQLITRLHDVAPVYSLDLPGFGRSSLNPDRDALTFKEHCAVVSQFLQQVVGRPALLVGNSLGGWLALRIALERPDLVTATVALNPAGVHLDRQRWEATKALFQPTTCADVRRFYGAMFGHVPPLIYFAQPETLKRLWRRSIQDFISTIEEHDFLTPDMLRAIQVPLTIIWGQADKLIPASSREILQEALPNAQFVLLPGCGHMPQIERPRQTADTIRALLASE